MFPKINILLVDDEGLFRAGLISLFIGSNINVSAQAANGRLALAELKKQKFDLVLLDLEMPVLDGNKTLNNIKQRFPRAKVIIISSYHDEQLIKDYFNRGAKAYLSKNEDITTVISAIRAVHSGNIYMDNIPELLKIKAVRNRHYFKLLYTSRELEVIALLILDKTVEEIAAELCLSQSTVANRLTAIYKKAGVKTKAGFMSYANSVGIQYLGNPSWH